jgi:N-acyl amino acid synthase of PEP-CTERM/exosortase system
MRHNSGFALGVRIYTLGSEDTSGALAQSAVLGELCEGHGRWFLLAGFSVLLPARHFEVVRASTPSLLDEAYRLRYQVYCVENAYENPGEKIGGREVDIYDERSAHALLVHKLSGTVAGTVRVILPGIDVGALPLPINTVTSLPQAELLRRLPRSQTAEISRFAISKEFRRRFTEAEDRRLLRYITIGLIRGVLEVCRDNEIQYVCAIMERALIRLLAKLGLVFEHVGDLIEYHGLRQPCVAQLSQLIAGGEAEGTLLWRYAEATQS